MWSRRQLRIRESGDPAGETVVVLGGIGPNFRQMDRLARVLGGDGYRVLHADYPSTHHSLATLAREHLAPALEGSAINPALPLHFVTFSMGGILTRMFLSQSRPANLGRVVMLAPPNGGSEVADWLAGFPPYRWGFGPAGQELTTAPHSVPNALGPADFPLGVVAGTRSLDPWFAWRFDGPHDGKVAVARTRLDGMADFVTVAASHYTIMRHPSAIRHVRRFLRAGCFSANRQPVLS